MTFGDLIKCLRETLDFLYLEYNVQLLSSESKAYKKTDADLVIKSSFDESVKFAVLLSKTNEIDLGWAKLLIKIMTYDSDYWMGLVWDDGNLLKFKPQRNNVPEYWETVDSRYLDYDLLIEYFEYTDYKLGIWPTE